MIVYDFDCGGCGGRFESWFASGGEHDRLAGLNLLTCPACGSSAVRKAPMAPAVPRKAGASPLQRLAAIQSEMVGQSRWVGDGFPDVARAIHSGEQEAERIHGRATLGEARDLIEEGVPVLPLPLPIVPPIEVN